MKSRAHTRLEEALLEARLCRDLLDDLPDVSPVDVVAPYLRAWFLAGETLAALEDRDWVSVPDKRAFIDEHLLALSMLDDAGRQEFWTTFDRLAAIHATVEECPELKRETLLGLVEHLGTLERILALLRRRVQAPAWYRKRRFVWLSAVAGVLVAVLAAGTFLGRSAGPWSIAYFRSLDRSDTPIYDRAAVLELSWGNDQSPFGTGPFSLEAMSCLTLTEARELRFELGSDDGSRLYVDGRMLIDNWGRHEHRSKRALERLEAGVHTLRVEYFQEDASASLELKLGEQGALLDPTGGGSLSYPRHRRCEGS